ncbi:MAG: WD40 repeat domain-containing protein [Epsilonproteobacteria bacterium]|nr:WD40 repeat domain-containing protein [Campylobacterota bacterium]
MRTLMILVSAFVLSWAQSVLTPQYTLKASGTVQDLFLEGKNLYCATDAGSVDVFDTETKRVIEQIHMPKIQDFAGDVIPAKIYSVDVLKGRLLIVAQASKGFRELWMYENKKLIKLIGIERELLITKARFVDGERVLLGMLSNMIVLHNIKQKVDEYALQVSTSSFSDFALSEDKKSFVSTDESGIIRRYESYTGRELEELEALNLDRVYQLDYKKGVVLSAGQDRRAVVYKKSENYYLGFDFLLYSCALSPNAKLGAVAYNEQNEILVFNVATKSKLYNLVGQDATMTKILFVDESSLFSSSDSVNVNFWKLK